MYLEHFNLQEMPFRLTPGSRFLYLTGGHQAALEHLHFGIGEGSGFTVLVGEVGSGKTTLCRAFLGRLESKFVTALILNPVLTETQMLRHILAELGMPDAKGDKLSLREQLNEFLIHQADLGREVVLMIDEAQTLTRDMLENMRLLSNLETENKKLLQIVLVGQPELRNTLNDQRLRQLLQRINVYYYLSAMSEGDTAEYVRHRLAVAGANGRPSFDRDALKLIHEYSQGIPRKVNVVCDRALLATFSQGKEQVSVDAVEAAIEELTRICQ